MTMGGPDKNGVRTSELSGCQEILDIFLQYGTPWLLSFLPSLYATAIVMPQTPLNGFMRASNPL